MGEKYSRIEHIVAGKMDERGETVSTAESATGGMVGSLLTDVPGSSDYFDRAYVTYSHRAKEQAIGVDRELVDEEGAVSTEVAKEMARGIRDTARTDWGLSITGYAGPKGGDEEDPVGTVYIGIAYTEGKTDVFRHEFEGQRLERKEEFARQALKDLNRVIERKMEDN